MTIDQHVAVTVRINNAGIPKQGFGTIGVLSYTTAFVDRSRTYRRLVDAITDGIAEDSPTGRSLSRIFGQSPHPQTVKVLRGIRPPTQKYTIEVDDVEVGKLYGMTVEGEGVETTEIEYTPEADLTFVDADITVGTDLIAKADHGMVTGAGPYRLSNAGGALPTGVGIAVDTNVWIYAPTDGTFGLATSRANALLGTMIDITAAAGGGTHTLRRAQNDVIVAQLVQALNDVVDKNFTAVHTVGAGETDYIVVTATAPGDWFSIALTDGQIDNLSIKQDHVDPGIVDDLTEITLIDNDWYYLDTSFNSEAMVLEAAEWIEAQKFKAYIVDVCDTECEDTVAGSGDVIDQLNDLGYKRTVAEFTRNPANKLAAGSMGRVAALNVGTWTLAYKTITGAIADGFTATQDTNLAAKKATIYKTEASRSILWQGQVPSDEYGFLDITVGLDFVIDLIQKNAFGVFVGLDKVSYTDEDIAVLRSSIEAGIDTAKSDKHKVVAKGTPGDPDDPEPTVTFPRVADIDPSARALRQLPDGECNFRVQGAVHTLDVTLTVTF